MLLLESTPTASADQDLDRIMVIVNEGVITQSDLDREMGLVEMELRSAGQTIPPRENLARQLLEDLIVDHILLEVAGRLNITVSNQELQYALSSIAGQNRLTLAQLRQTIEQHRVRFADYLDDLRKQLTVRQLINRQISGTVNVTEIEIDEYLEQHPELSVLRPVEIELAHIFLKVPTDSSEVEVVGRQELAQNIRQRILDGLPFGEAAQQYSDSPEAAQDGVLGWRKEDQLPDVFLSALDGVLAGGISEVFRSPNGLHCWSCWLGVAGLRPLSPSTRCVISLFVSVTF
jgi:peptidyl-prolyl cis-trans isomerase SurA